jgi:hypothetical protein
MSKEKEQVTDVGNGILTLNCAVRPCVGEKCRNWNCCEPRKDGREIRKTEQAKVY